MKSLYSGLDCGSLVLKGLLPRREEEDKFCHRESLCPIVEIVGVVENSTPGGVEERRQFSPGSLRTMTEEDDPCFEKFVERKRKTGGRRRNDADGRRWSPRGKVGVIGRSMWARMLS